MEGLISAPAKTLEEYHLRVGQVQGLQIALDNLLSIIRQQDDN